MHLSAMQQDRHSVSGALDRPQEQQQPLLPRRRTHTFIAPSATRQYTITTTDLRLRRSLTEPPTIDSADPWAAYRVWDRSRTSLQEWQGGDPGHHLQAHSTGALVFLSDSERPRRTGRKAPLLTCTGAKIHQRRALQRMPQQLPKEGSSSSTNHPLPLQGIPQPHSPIDPEDLPPQYVASVNNAIASYNTTPTSSGRSSPTSMDTHSTLSISQGGWTTGNTTERSSLDSSCYSMDEFERQAASTVNQHFEEFESMLFEGPKETSSNTYREGQEWITQFPHIRVLGKQLMSPKDTGFHMVPTSGDSTNSTPRPSTTETLDLNLSEHDLSFTSDTQGLALSGRKVKATHAPLDATSMLTSQNHRGDSSARISSQYDYLHEEIFAQDGVVEEIIAVDYKNIYEDNMEHKKQITPRRRRVGYPPITPNACVKDSVMNGAFDSLWFDIVSWTQGLVRRYMAEVESKNQSSNLYNAPAPAFRASSFILPSSGRSPHPMDNQVSLDGMLKVCRMDLRNRNSLSMSGGSMSGDVTELSIGSHAPLGPVVQKAGTSRPATVNPHRWRQSQGRRLDPLPEPSKVHGSDEGRFHQPSPQNALRVKQIIPTGSHRLSSPPNILASRLPPLESGLPSLRKSGHRASSAILDNKEGRTLGGKHNSNIMEVSRPSTTQAFRSDTPFSMNRRSSTPLGQTMPARQLYLMSGHRALGITGSGLHPSAADPTPNILEDQEGPTREDIHHNQWIPSTPSFLKRSRMRSLRY